MPPYTPAGSARAPVGGLGLRNDEADADATDEDETDPRESERKAVRSYPYLCLLQLQRLGAATSIVATSITSSSSTLHTAARDGLWDLAAQPRARSVPLLSACAMPQPSTVLAALWAGRGGAAALGVWGKDIGKGTPSHDMP